MLSNEKQIKFQSLRRIGYSVNLENPSTFNDWLNYYKLQEDKFKIRADYADKSFVKIILQNRKNTPELEKMKIIPTIMEFDNLKHLEIYLLNATYPLVIKLNFGSGGTYLLSKFKEYFLIKEDLQYRFETNYSRFSIEKHYDFISKKIIIEPYVTDNLDEIKFFCSSGKILFYYYYENISLNNGNEKLKEKRGIYYPDDTKVSFEIGKQKNYNLKLPKNLNAMKNAACELSREFEFVRIDFLVSNDSFYFGEFTFTPSGGYVPFDDFEVDKKFGALLHEN